MNLLFPSLVHLQDCCELCYLHTKTQINVLWYFLGGLSTTAIILIIVGCVVGVALIGGVLFVLLKPKKKGKGTKICTTQSI